MQEDVRLAYLQAMGIIAWQPRQAMSDAADVRLLSSGAVAAPSSGALETLSEEGDDTQAAIISNLTPAQDEPVRPAENAPALAPPMPQPEPLRQAAADPDVATLAPFYLQLWLAGPCALLVEINEPGLEKATAPYQLLCDILRAARLPDKPVLFADFQWPLTRNPQFDRSAAAASQAMAAFIQARLEEQSVLSLGCLGQRCGLLVETDQARAAQLLGREIALDGMPPVWLGAGLETMLREPSEKARLWKLLKRVMPRWTNQE